MSKTAKSKNSQKRREQKKARKTANYLRFGPKEGQKGRRQKRKKYGSFTPKQSSSSKNFLTPPGPTARKRRRGFKKRSDNLLPALPLLPLRKRLHLGAKEIGERRGRC